MRLTPVLILLAMVAGCASSPVPSYYRLAALAEPATAAATLPAGGVVIGPFDLADYLDRPQLVTRAGANALAVADYERWAEPLDANFQAVVAANVGRLLGSDQVLEFPAQAILKGAQRVTGRVLGFDVDGGNAVLEVQWGVVDGKGTVLRPGRISRYQAPVSGAGTAARVAALNATVTAFSADVAAALR